MVVRFFSIFLLLFSFESFGYSIKIYSKVEPDTVHFAQKFSVIIEVEAPLDSAVVLRDVPKSRDYVLYDSVWSVSVDSNVRFTKLKFDFIPFVEGDIDIYGFRLQVGRVIYNLDTFRIYVLPIEFDTVELSKIDTTKFIKIFDVKGPIDTPLTFRELWLRYRYWFLLILVLLLIVGLLYWYFRYRRNRRETEVIEEERQIDPYEYVVNYLSQLKSENLCIKGDYETFYFKLSNILRWYLEQEFNFSALEMTTNELEVFLKYKFDYTLSEISVSLLDILRRADMVKFAKIEPVASDCLRDIETAEQIVEYINQEKSKEEENAYF